MIIPIDDKYRIKSDTRCWMIQKYRQETEKRRASWEPIKWFNTLEGTAQALVELKLRASDVETLGGALAEAKDATAAVCRGLAAIASLEGK